MWKNHTLLEQPAGHLLVHTLPLGASNFFNQHFSQVNQCGCVGHSTTKSMFKLIPQVFGGILVAL